MRWQTLLIGFALVVGLLGCNRGPVSAHLSRGDMLTVTIWASERCPHYGETVTLRATVTNRELRPLVVEVKDRPVFDIIVGGDSELGRWSAGKPLTPDLTRLELGPWQSKTIEMQWVFTESVGVIAYFIDIPSQPDLALNPRLFLFSLCPGY